MNVPLLDLQTQYRQIQPELTKVIQEVCAQQSFILGSHVEQLERTLAQFIGTRFAVGVASGSDALLLSLMELDIQPGDEVITVPFYVLCLDRCYFSAPCPSSVCGCGCRHL